ncbi:MAG: GLUG motif-containing protein [Acutalibacteraceae bacterium]
MKTHLRKGLAAILCIAMLVGLIPGVGTVTVSAADNDSTVPQKNADGYYEIGNADQLYWFAQQVNSGSTSLNAVLTADITVNENVLNDNGTLNTALTNPREWTPIGNTSHIYSGTFDGQKHTVSGLYFNDTEPTTGMYVGLFGCNGGTIQNVGVVDSYIKGFNFLGGVCGYNLNGTITNCHNSGEVIATATASACVGGVCGWNRYIIECCYNSGKVSASGDSVQKASAGGVCGWNYGLIENCYNISEVSATAAEVNVGGVCGYNYSDGEISCCYYLESTASSAVGSDDGTTDLTESKTEAQFKSGEVAYLLNGGVTDGTQVWYQNLNNGVTPDDYPVFDGVTVYYGYLCNTNEKIYSNYPLNKNENESHDFDINGFCNNCGAYQPATDSDDDGVYEIGNAGQLYWFAALVNGDKTKADFDAKNTGAKAVLTADITVNSNLLNSLVKDADGNVTNGDSFRSWTPIGNKSNNFTGTFDGQGYTVSGLYFNDTVTNNVGLFGYADNGSSVSNVGVVDSYFNARSFVGGVCGCNGYNCTITNCYNTGEVIGADNHVGGVCGYNKNGKIDNCYNTGTVGGFNYVGGVCGENYFYYGEQYYYGKIDNCYNTGKVSGPGSYIGGVCGSNGDRGTITNCYNTGEVIGTDSYVGGVSGYNRSTITNCYYLEDTASRAVGTDIGSTNLTESKTEVQFNSGEVAYLLQSGQTADDKGNIPQVWGQNIDIEEPYDAYPVLSGAKVYENYTYAGCSGNPGNPTIKYSNTQSDPVYADHYDADGDGECDYCGIVMDGSFAKLAFASLSLKGNIGVNFYMELSTEVIDDSSAYMQFTLPNGSTEKILVSAAEKNTTITEGKTYYVFSCEVAAKEMTADIKAQIISGNSASESFTYAVKNYADYIMSHTEDYSEDVISLVEAMLNYGAASQEYFDYNTDSLANSSLTDEQK